MLIDNDFLTLVAALLSLNFKILDYLCTRKNAN